jgi:hypothetical protein
MTLTLFGAACALVTLGFLLALVASTVRGGRRRFSAYASGALTVLGAAVFLGAALST